MTWRHPGINSLSLLLFLLIINPKAGTIFLLLKKKQHAYHVETAKVELCYFCSDKMIFRLIFSVHRIPPNQKVGVVGSLCDSPRCPRSLAELLAWMCIDNVQQQLLCCIGIAVV